MFYALDVGNGSLIPLSFSVVVGRETWKTHMCCMLSLFPGIICLMFSAVNNVATLPSDVAAAILAPHVE